MGEFPRPCDGCGRLRDLTHVATHTERHHSDHDGLVREYLAGPWLCEACRGP